MPDSDLYGFSLEDEDDELLWPVLVTPADPPATPEPEELEEPLIAINVQNDCTVETPVLFLAETQHAEERRWRAFYSALSRGTCRLLRDFVGITSAADLLKHGPTDLLAAGIVSTRVDEIVYLARKHDLTSWLDTHSQQLADWSDEHA